MNKIVLLLSFFFILSASDLLALNPIIINNSFYGQPAVNSTGNDQDYHPNNIFATDTIKCPSTVAISQTFDPQRIGTSEGQPVYQPYIVTQISGLFNFERNYNRGPEKQLTHLANRNKFTDDINTKKAFLSLDINKPVGSLGITSRSTPSRVLKCQKGQRLVKAVNSLFPDNNGVDNNEQVAWNCGGEIFSIVDRTTGVGCSPVRLSDIAAALSSEPIFYSPSDNCYSETTIATTLTVFPPKVNPISVDSARQLFKNNVEIVDNGSLTRGIEICTSSGCQRKEQQIPQGGVQATYQDVVSKFIAKKEPLRQIDLCQAVPRSLSINQANSLSLNVIIQGLQEQITNASKTITGNVKTTYNFDSRASLDKDETWLNLLLPKSVQDKYSTTNLPGSSSDGKDLSPGIDTTRAVFAKSLLPKNF